MVGTIIMKHTTKVIVKDKKLIISLNSPIVKNELRMLRSELLQKIQEQIGIKYITDVIIK
jgi:predicted nucleic acid-binding Zn ribbon protein